MKQLKTDTDPGRRLRADRRKEDLGYDDSHPIFKWDRRNGGERRTDEDRRRQYVEKRKRSRFKVKGGLVAELYKAQFFKLKRKWTAKQVEILDLSTSGVRLQYWGQGMRTPDFELLSLGLVEDGRKVEDLPFKVITDHKISDHPEGGQVRECGLKFLSLSSDQKARLSYLIQHWTHDTASRQTDLPSHR